MWEISCLKIQPLYPKRFRNSIIILRNFYGTFPLFAFSFGFMKTKNSSGSDFLFVYREKCNYHKSLPDIGKILSMSSFLCLLIMCKYIKIKKTIFQKIIITIKNIQIIILVNLFHIEQLLVMLYCLETLNLHTETALGVEKLPNKLKSRKIPTVTLK